MIRYFDVFVEVSLTITLTPKKSVEPIVIFCGASAGETGLLIALLLN